MLLVNAPSYPLYKCVTLNVRLKAELYLVTLEQDTGFNIGSNDVSSDIKVDPDEFSLQRQDPKISPQQCCAEGSLGSWLLCTLRMQPFFISCVLTKREELSFFTVFAFPKDSRMGLACKSWRSSSPWKRRRTLKQFSITTKINSNHFRPLIFTVKRRKKKEKHTCRQRRRTSEGDDGTHKDLTYSQYICAVTKLGASGDLEFKQLFKTLKTL